MLKAAGIEGARFAANLAGAVVLSAGLAALAGPHGFFVRLWDALSLDFGASTITGADSLNEIAAPLAASMEILLPGLVLALLLGVPLGIALAHRASRGAALPFAQLGRAVPVFCAALAIAAGIAAFAPGIEPGHGAGLDAALATNDAGAILAALMALAPLVLPVGFAGAGVTAAAVSAAMAEALAEPYRVSLNRLGLAEREIVRVYVTRRVFAASLGSLGDVVLAAIAALAVVERLFGWPGAGAEFIHAASLLDWPVVAALVFAIAAARIAADLLGALAALAVAGVARAGRVA